MAVYVDDLFKFPKPRHWRGRWVFADGSCHLFADTLDELHEFAAKIGMKRAWFQDRTRLPHYDLTPSRRAMAVRLGAIEADRRTTVEHMRSRTT